MLTCRAPPRTSPPNPVAPSGIGHRSSPASAGDSTSATSAPPAIPGTTANCLAHNSRQLMAWPPRPPSSTSDRSRAAGRMRGTSTSPWWAAAGPSGPPSPGQLTCTSPPVFASVEPSLKRPGTSWYILLAEHGLVAPDTGWQAARRQCETTVIGRTDAKAPVLAHERAGPQRRTSNPLRRPGPVDAGWESAT